MDAIVGIFWFFYLLICPIGTVAVLLGFAATCRSTVDLVLRGIPALLILVLVLGPVWTEIGPMPWWCPRVSPHLLNPTAGVHYLVWQYAAICVGAFVVIGFASIAIRARPERGRAA